ncbi:PREDICTED: reverse mRNAase [Prunus dulcis]|uniref:PREDICTED: reverse mRNAase n=1 Tax=Prunus dulcis TaxID=3755 RepID=A0A5E4F862_PRUDU|nr:PREDICTED: reverse mRNAase [Prunus dulcis]
MWRSHQPCDIRVGLDRAIATQAWRDLFPQVVVRHLPPINSDTVPLLVSIRGAFTNSHRKVKWFRFEEMWQNHEGCETIIQEGWNSIFGNHPIQGFVWKVRATHDRLSKWSKEIFGGRIK